MVVASIKFKVVLFACVAVLIPATVLGIIAYSHTRQLLIERVDRELSGVASIAARDLDLWLQRRFHELDTFAASAVVRSSLSEDSDRQSAVRIRLRTYLQSLQRRYPEYASLAVVARDGQMLAASPDGDAMAPALPPLTTPQPVRALAQAGAGGHPRLRLLVYLGTADPMQGALVADLDLQPLRQRARQIAGELELLIADRGRRLLFLSSAPLPVEPTIVPAWVSRGVGAEGVRRYRNHQGVEVFGAASSTSQGDLTVVTETASEQVLQELVDLRWRALLILAGLLSVLGTVGYLFSLSLARPLNQLTEGARKVAAGDLAVGLPAGRRDELGYLTQVFNDMVSRLREGREAVSQVQVRLLAQNRALETLTVTDNLTGLRNRKSLTETIDQYIARFRRNGRPFCVLMLDIDHFKVINDRHGHLVGDAVLRQFATLIGGAIRSIDYAARFGGEEFTLVLDETEQSHAWETAERIRLRVAGEAMDVNGLGINITVSIGIAEVCAGDDGPAPLLGRADAALYEAKRAGRNRVCFAAALGGAEEEEERLLGRL
jgi:diguanylate cyclase (GGDEF)-like protein